MATTSPGQCSCTATKYVHRHKGENMSPPSIAGARGHACAFRSSASAGVLGRTFAVRPKVNSGRPSEVTRAIKPIWQSFLRSWRRRSALSHADDDIPSPCSLLVHSNNTTTPGSMCCGDDDGRASRPGHGSQRHSTDSCSPCMHVQRMVSRPVGAMHAA